MPVTKVHPGCTEFREFATRDGKGYENRICGRPIYLNGVCDQCWRCNEHLRGPYSPMRPNAAAERLDSDGYTRLHIEDDTLTQKGVDHDVAMAMTNIDNELRELLK